MRAVIVGAGAIGVMTADLLLKRRHEVVIVESKKERIEELTARLDCGFLHGDGSKPDILKEADPGATQVVFCLTGNDHVNIIAGLVGQSLGFPRVVVKIEDPQFEHICMELGLEDTIVPAHMTARHLAEMLEGQDLLDLSAMIKDEARLFSFVMPEGKKPTVAQLELPDDARVMCVYRNNAFMLPDADTALQPTDEVVIVTHDRNLAELRERWSPLAARRKNRKPLHERGGPSDDDAAGGAR